MGFSQANVVSPTQTSRSHALRTGAFDPGPTPEAVLEHIGFLARPGGLDGLLLDLRSKGEIAGGLFSPSTLLSVSTSKTIEFGKATLNDRLTAPIGKPFSPCLGRLALGTGDDVDTSNLFGLALALPLGDRSGFPNIAAQSLWLTILRLCLAGPAQQSFCYDTPEFISIYNRLGPNTSTANIIDLLIKQVGQSLQLDTLYQMITSYATGLAVSKNNLKEPKT